MTIERFRELLDAQPFQPFTIQLADGRKVPVAHREFIAAAPTGRTVVVFEPNDTLSIFESNEVARLELGSSM